MSAASRSFSPEGRAASFALLILVTLLALYPGMARACEPRVVQTPDTVRIDYDPFVFARPPGRFDIRIANDASEPCDLELRFRWATGEPVRAIDLGGVSVDFRAREGAAVVVGGAEPGLFRLSIPPNTASDIALDLVVVDDAVAEAGEHRQTLRADLGMAGAEPLLTSLPFDVVVASPPRAQLNIAGAAGAFGSGDSVAMIDFGDARTGLVKHAFLQIRANTASRVAFQSENAGVLRRPGSVSEESTIAYEVSVAGQPIDLRHPTTLEVDPPRTLGGQSLALDFTLGEVGSQMSGQYRDLLTISIDPD